MIIGILQEPVQVNSLKWLKLNINHICDEWQVQQPVTGLRNWRDDPYGIGWINKNDRYATSILLRTSYRGST